MIGIPLYGRAFEQTLGLGQSYNGVRLEYDTFFRCPTHMLKQVGPGTLEAGIYSYNALPRESTSQGPSSSSLTFK